MLEPQVMISPAAQLAPQKLTDFALPPLSSGPSPLANTAGRVVLLVNVASRCGFTGQYAALEALHQRLGPKGLTLIGIPSNDFAGQEPGSASDIQQFCQLNYGVSFPLAAKQKVVGAGAHPLFGWLRQSLGPMAGPYWNFYKYLINRQGQPVAWFSPLTAPDSPKFLSRLEQELA